VGNKFSMRDNEDIMGRIGNPKDLILCLDEIFLAEDGFCSHVLGLTRRGIWSGLGKED